MQAPGHFLNGIFSMDIKLPPGNSGGVNFAWYLMDTTTPTNKDKRHCEIDVELYGYKSPSKVLLALNVFAQGKQNLAQVRALFCSTVLFVPDLLYCTALSSMGTRAPAKCCSHSISLPKGSKTLRR